MSRLKNFIITQDKTICDILLANGFNLLSESCGIYTFVNEQMANFSFANLDMTKIHFTDKLHI